MKMNGSPFAPFNTGIIRIIGIALGALALVAQFTLKLSLPEAPQPGQVVNTSTQAPPPDASPSGSGQELMTDRTGRPAS